MKITFEEDGAKLVMELPHTNPRAKWAKLKEFGCHSLDAEVEVLQEAEEAMATILGTRVRVDKDGNKASVLRMVALFLVQIDQGTPVDFWDTLVKMQKKS